MSVRSRVALLVLVTFPLQVSAQQQTPRSIGEVTLFGEEQLKVEAATKTEIPISKAPSAVTIVTAKQIHESGARTVPDILRLVAGVNVRWNPMVQTIDIRGFGENPFSNRVLLLIDGIPYNSGDTGGFPLSPAFDLFPVQNIKRIEVVRGPGSSLYGENAYWGVINIVTLSGEDLAGGTLQLFGGSRSTGSASAAYGAKFGETSVIGAVRLLQSMFPMEFWKESDSKFKAADIFVKGSYKDFKLQLYRHDDRLGGFTEEFPVQAGFPPTAVFRSAHSIKQALNIVGLRYNRVRDGAPFTYSADVSWSQRNGMHCAGCHAAQQKPEFAGPENHGYQAIADFRLGIRTIPGHDALVGLEARRLDRADHKHELSPDAQAVSGYDKVAIYAQDQFDLLRDRLRAVAGIRYDGKTDLFEAKTSPRLSLIYTPNDRLVVRGGYSTAFRFPSFSELYQDSWFLTISSDRGIFPSFPRVVFAPNPTLKPEEIRTFDVGAEYQISRTLSAKADLYRSRVKDFIVIGIHRASVVYENHPSEGTVTGGELELRSNIAGRVTGFANWAYETRHDFGSAVDSTGTPLEFPYAPKNKINVGAYGGPFSGVRGSAELSWRDQYVAPRIWYLVESNFQDPTVRPLPSYTLLNARLSYDLPFRMGAKDRPIRLSLFGHNLLDERPRETLIGVDTTIAGREIFFQVELDF